MSTDGMTIDERIDALQPEYFELWTAICRMETPTSDKAALDAQTDFLSKFALEKGYRVHREPFAQAGDCLTIERIGSGAPVMFMAHMDTVHPKGAFGQAIVTTDGTYLYGPGVVDCKGGIVAALLAMEALSETDCFVRLTLTADEEFSSRLSGPAGIRFIERCAADAKAVLNCETGRAGELTVARKGIARIRLDVRGKAAHAGNAYFSGVSAVREAARKVLAIEQMSAPDGCTYNCGVICGGSTANTVPDACSVQVDVRAADEDRLKTAICNVERIASEPGADGASCEATTLSVRPPMVRTEANLRLFRRIIDIAAANGLPALAPMERGGGSDAAYTTRIGIPTVCSCGPVGSGEHTLSERAEIASLARRAKLLAHTAAAL